MIPIMCGDGKTRYWQNSFIKWHCWVSHNIYSTCNCNDCFCRGRGCKEFISQLNEATDVQKVHLLIGVAHIRKRSAGWLFPSVHH